MARPVLKVDELDFRILRAILLGEDTDYFRSDRVPADAVARDLGIHRKTVAARMKRMTDAGFFLPLTLDIEPVMLGLVGAKAFLEGADARDEEALESVRHIEGVQALLGYMEGLDVVLYAEDEASLVTRIELARRITRARRVELDIHTSRDFPGAAPARTLARTDARLLSALLLDARAPFPRLAERLGVSARTLERRYAKLSDEGVVTMMPGGDGHADFAGMLLAYAQFRLDGDARSQRRAVAELMKLLPNHVVRNVGGKDRAHFFVYASSAAELDGQLREARRVPGVVAVTTRTQTWAGGNPRWASWLASVLERRAAAGSARGSS